MSAIKMFPDSFQIIRNHFATQSLHMTNQSFFSSFPDFSVPLKGKPKKTEYGFKLLIIQFLQPGLCFFWSLIHDSHGQWYISLTCF